MGPNALIQPRWKWWGEWERWPVHEKWLGMHAWKRAERCCFSLYSLIMNFRLHTSASRITPFLWVIFLLGQCSLSISPKIIWLTHVFVSYKSKKIQLNYADIQKYPKRTIDWGFISTCRSYCMASHLCAIMHLVLNFPHSRGICNGVTG